MSQFTALPRHKTDFDISIYCGHIVDFNVVCPCPRGVLCQEYVLLRLVHKLCNDCDEVIAKSSIYVYQDDGIKFLLLIWAALENVDIEEDEYLKSWHIEREIPLECLEGIAAEQGRRLLEHTIWQLKPTTIILPSNDEFHNVTRRCQDEEGWQQILVDIVNYSKDAAP
jgi:hypothetical protein